MFFPFEVSASYAYQSHSVDYLLLTNFLSNMSEGQLENTVRTQIILYLILVLIVSGGAKVRFP